MKHSAIINVDAPGPRISKHIYGHFAEHLGNCIYGGFYVGEGSPIPNKNGIRLDVVEAFKKLKIPNLRWPGGCFADEYHWMDGIGPKTSRPTMINTHWGGITENNHFGTHEFMELCELLETEPYITGNVGSGTIHEMSQWIEYLTFDGQSPMTELRKKNGRNTPWKVRFWGIGNENWGCGGGMTPDYYADKARNFSIYCRNYGNNRLYKIAGGPNVDDYHWMETLMKKLVYCPKGLPEDRFVNGISLHYYSFAGTWEQKGRALETDIDKWLVLMKNAWRMDELITRHSTIMDQYDPHRKIGLVVDEWGTWHQVEEGTNPGFLYQQNTIRDALVASIHLDIFHHHAERVYMANLAQAVNVLMAPIFTEKEKIILTPTYHIFEMNKEHMDGIVLPIILNPYNPHLEWNNQRFPAISLSASRKETRIHISISNLDPISEHSLSIDLRGSEAKDIHARILTGKTLNSHNSFENPHEVEPQDFDNFSVKNNKLQFIIPAHSFITFSFSMGEI